MSLIWLLLTVIALIALAYYWKKKSSVWGGLTIGAVIGLLVAIILAVMGNGFSWSIIGKGAVIGTLLGVVADRLGKLSDVLKRRL